MGSDQPHEVSLGDASDTARPPKPPDLRGLGRDWAGEPADEAPIKSPDRPALTKGALGDGFESGVVDPDGHFSDEERRIADHLAEAGAMVHARPVQLETGLSNPDSMVRRSPQDEGTVTEFKTPRSGTPNALARHIGEAGGQVDAHGGGDVVIDGRPLGLTQDAADAGYSRAEIAARDLGKPIPEQVHFILADGQMYAIRKGGG